MTVEVVLVPSSGDRPPAQARDHGVLASLLESNASPSSNSPMDSWRDAVRVVEADRIRIRLPGTLDDHSGSTLDAFETAITNNLDVEAHPDGWQEVAPPEP